MITNDVHNLAGRDFEEVWIEALARVYELILSLPGNEEAHRHADNMTDGQRGNECETRCVHIVTQNVVGGEEL